MAPGLKSQVSVDVLNVGKEVGVLDTFALNSSRTRYKDFVSQGTSVERLRRVRALNGGARSKRIVKGYDD